MPPKFSGLWAVRWCDASWLSQKPSQNGMYLFFILSEKTNERADPQLKDTFVHVCLNNSYMTAADVGDHKDL